MDLILGVVSFTGIVLLLVVVILLARSQLVASGNVLITINGDEENKLEVKTGSKLLPFQHVAYVDQVQGRVGLPN